MSQFIRTLFFAGALQVLLGGCGFFASGPEHEQEFVVVDRNSNQVLNTYEYDYAVSDSPLRTTSYAPGGLRVNKIREYSYDDRGYVRRVIDEIPGVDRQIITYRTEEIRDEEGRISRVIHSSSDGKDITMHYGYDEAGRLRGTVVETDADTIEMKDYDSQE